MQHLEVSFAVRRIYKSLGFKGLRTKQFVLRSKHTKPPLQNPICWCWNKFTLCCECYDTEKYILWVGWRLLVWNLVVYIVTTRSKG